MGRQKSPFAWSLLPRYQGILEANVSLDTGHEQSLFKVYLAKTGHSVIPGESKKGPAFERLLLPDYICNDTLQHLIE